MANVNKLLENMEKALTKRLRELDERRLDGEMLTGEEEAERKNLKELIQDSYRIRSTPARRPAMRGHEADLSGDVDPKKPRRLSFKQAMDKAENQISFHEYSRQHACWGILHDMCRVMAEVYMMSPCAKVKINGEELEAEIVAEVLEQVTEEMAYERAEELLDVITGVTCIKAYLRSALYNKVFEFEAADVKLTEQVKRDMGWQ